MRKSGLISLCAALMIAAAPEARAGVDVFTGGEWDTREQGFFYLGLTASPDDAEGRALLGRLFLYDQRYGYESAGKQARVSGPGATVSAGMRTTRGAVTLGGYAGLDMRRKETSVDGAVTETDSSMGAAFGAELYAFGEGGKSLGLNASYSTMDGFAWLRARGKKEVAELGGGRRLLAGLDAIAMGNSDTAAFQAGGLVEISGTSGLSAIMKAGLKDTSGLGGSAYFGVELYRPF